MSKDLKTIEDHLNKQADGKRESFVTENMRPFRDFLRETGVKNKYLRMTVGKSSINEGENPNQVIVSLTLDDLMAFIQRFINQETKNEFRNVVHEDFLKETQALSKTVASMKNDVYQLVQEKLAQEQWIDEHE